MTDHSTRPPAREHPYPDDLAAALRADATELLAAIADKLAGHRPDDRMLEDTRLALACTYATRRRGFSEPADQLERMLLARMPRVERDITRGEYALILRRAAEGEQLQDGGQ
ncbi:hypothetical protein DMA15_17520 [Streptomyces sp. WAC 01529]|uniref:hypothetical protein n=1 Tax=Streptomyces sp. WAC 01529 TaxID=2203205 RepID=UPI000F6DC992|nr:hypothetical protein [Streptomyces sp. WAC 01529]AZM54147.1 hypothetical protein DMA15_17520 [Streptomyces sp. WAC 01529]